VNDEDVYELFCQGELTQEEMIKIYSARSVIAKLQPDNLGRMYERFTVLLNEGQTKGKKYVRSDGEL
jgi:hypothetical protein